MKIDSRHFAELENKMSLVFPLIISLYFIPIKTTTSKYTGVPHRVLERCVECPPKASLRLIPHPLMNDSLITANTEKSNLTHTSVS